MIMQEQIEKLRKLYEETLVVALKTEAPSTVEAGLSQLRSAAAYLREGGRKAKVSYKSFREARKALRTAFRQKTVTAYPGVRDIGEFYYHRRFTTELVQDYLEIREAQRLDIVSERHISNISGPIPGALGQTGEENIKQTVEPSLGIVGNPFRKISFTSVITEETLRANPSLLDYWSFYAMRRLEYELHVQLVNALLGNGVAFTITSQGLPAPRIIDLIEFLRRNYNRQAPEGLDIGWEAVGVVFPQGYWDSLTIQQDTTGTRRDTQLISDLALIPHSGANNSFTIIFGSGDLLVVYYDDVAIYLDRVVDQAEERNLYRFTAELFYTAIPRQGLSLFVTNTQASIAALT